MQHHYPSENSVGCDGTAGKEEQHYIDVATQPSSVNPASEVQAQVSPKIGNAMEVDAEEEHHLPVAALPAMVLVPTSEEEAKESDGTTEAVERPTDDRPTIPHNEDEETTESNVLRACGSGTGEAANHPLLGPPPMSTTDPNALSFEGECLQVSSYFNDSHEISAAADATNDINVSFTSQRRSSSTSKKDRSLFTTLRELDAMLEAAWSTPASVLDSYVYYYSHEGHSERTLPYRTKSLISHRSSISAIVMEEDNTAAQRRRASPFIRYEDEEADRAALRLKFHSETSTLVDDLRSPRMSTTSVAHFTPASRHASPKRPFVMPHHPLVRHFLRSPGAGAPFFPPGHERDAKAFLQESFFVCRAEDQARHRLQREMFAILRDWIPHKITLKELHERDKREIQRLVLREEKNRLFVEEGQQEERDHLQFLRNYDVRKELLKRRGISLEDGERLEALEKGEEASRTRICTHYDKELEKVQDAVDRELFEALRQEEEQASAAQASMPASSRKATGRRIPLPEALNPETLTLSRTRSPSRVPAGGHVSLAATLFNETTLLSSPGSANLEQTATLYGLSYHQSPKSVGAERRVRAGIMNRISLRELSKARREDIAEAHFIAANQMRSESAYLDQRHTEAKHRDLRKNYSHVVKQRDNRKKTHKEFLLAQEDLHAKKRAEARHDYLAYKWEWHMKQNPEDAEKVSQLCDKQLWKANIAKNGGGSQQLTGSQVSAIGAEESAFSVGIDPFNCLEDDDDEPANPQLENECVPSALVGRRGLAPMSERKRAAHSEDLELSGSQDKGVRRESGGSNIVEYQPRADVDQQRPSTVPTTLSSQPLSHKQPTSKQRRSVQSTSALNDSTTRPPTRAARNSAINEPPVVTVTVLAHRWQARKALEYARDGLRGGSPAAAANISTATGNSSKVDKSFNSRASAKSPPKRAKSGPAHPIDAQLAKAAMRLSAITQPIGGRHVRVVNLAEAEDLRESFSGDCQKSLTLAIESAKQVKKRLQLVEVQHPSTFNYDAYIAHLQEARNPHSDASSSSPLELLLCQLLHAQSAVHKGDTTLAHRLYVESLRTISLVHPSETQALRHGGNVVVADNIERSLDRLAMLQHKIGGFLCRASGQLQDSLSELQKGIQLENGEPGEKRLSHVSTKTHEVSVAPRNTVRLTPLNTEALSHGRPATATSTQATTPKSSIPPTPSGKGSFGTARRGIQQAQRVDQYGQLTRQGAFEEQRKKAQLVRSLKAATTSVGGGETPYAVWIAEGGKLAAMTDDAMSRGNPVMRLNIAAVLTQSGSCTAALKMAREAASIVTAQLSANAAAVMDAAEALDSASKAGEESGSHGPECAVTVLPFPNASEIAVTVLMAVAAAQRGLPPVSASGVPTERDSAPTTLAMVSDLAREVLPVDHPLRDAAGSTIS